MNEQQQQRDEATATIRKRRVDGTTVSLLAESGKNIETKQAETKPTTVDDPMMETSDQDDESNNNTVHEKSAAEFETEAERLYKKKDLSGLKRLVAELNVRIQYYRSFKDKLSKDDREAVWAFAEAKGSTKWYVREVEKEQAQAKQLASGRVAGIIVGLEEGLKHDYDLMEFQSKVLALFQWYTHEKNQYMAPYFPMIQSSGTGKTRLCVALREAINNATADLSEYECRTVLCGGGDIETLAEQDKYFDLNLDLNEELRLRELITVQLNGLCFDGNKCTKDKIVLLFDEAQFLMVGQQVALFRTILWWLREERVKKQVVAVFAGTSIKLARLYHDTLPVGMPCDAEIPYVNWSKGGNGAGPTKLYAPFYGIYTTGCFHNDVPSDAAKLSDFERAAFFGRPLFANLAKEKLLLAKDRTKVEGNKAVIDNFRLYAALKHMLVGQTEWWSKSEAALCSILGSRLHMGVITSLDVSSQLVSQAYAHLVQWHPNNNTGKAVMARVCFMPDPVCAALAMGMMMHWEWTLTAFGGNERFSGEKRYFWSSSCMELLSSGLWVPENGNVGETMTALYMLFCGDVLRHKEDPTLRKFSVSLLSWYSMMRRGTTLSAHASLIREEPCNEESSMILDTTSIMEVNFIQVCRNGFGASSHSWKTQKALEYMYNSATAIYVYPDCKAIGMVAAACVLREDGGKVYHPILVSVKCQVKVSASEIEKSFGKMKKLLATVREEPCVEVCPAALCLLVVVGVSDEEPVLQENASCNCDDLGQFPQSDTFRMIVVPKEDEFGISSAVSSMKEAQEKTAIFASHAYLYG